ncbi:DUF2987 domain-containing protein [Motilimonas pumila]|uniref:DUF2987 domain-containing protein n=1 Tax=Motilimonas pumila TaxID=2303987 RepID=UPI0013146659|nr:DUF2987 domain-containing protein [Motilimonas pumila]
MHKVVIGLCLLVSSSAFAAESKLKYSEFYKRLAAIEKEQLSLVYTAFYLFQADSEQACFYQQGQLLTNKEQVAVLQAKSGEILMPLSPKLKQDKADFIMTFDQVSDCRLSIQTLARPVSEGRLNTSLLMDINTEMHTLINSNAGFWGRMFIPEYLGLNIEFDKQGIRDLPQEFIDRLQAGRLTLSSAEIALMAEQNVSFDADIKTIKPWLAAQ